MVTACSGAHLSTLFDYDPVLALHLSTESLQFPWAHEQTMFNRDMPRRRRPVELRAAPLGTRSTSDPTGSRPGRVLQSGLASAPWRGHQTAALPFGLGGTVRPVSLCRTSLPVGAEEPSEPKQIRRKIGKTNQQIAQQPRRGTQMPRLILASVGHRAGRFHIRVRQAVLGDWVHLRVQKRKGAQEVSSEKPVN